MKILAIDTATEACSAALLLEGEINSLFEVQPRKHGDLILDMMDQLLRQADLRPAELDGLAFGRGPGAFTGVRIATGVAQGAALGAGIPLLPVSNLAALAQRLFREQGARRCLAAFDARMNEVYFGAYEVGQGDLAVLLGEEQVAHPDNLRLPGGGDWFAAGSGWSSHGDALKARIGADLLGEPSELLSHADDIARLGAAMLERDEAVPPREGLPVYLRDQVAVKKAG